jgi:hypothetical protein
VKTDHRLGEENEEICSMEKCRATIALAAAPLKEQLAVAWS